MKKQQVKQEINKHLSLPIWGQIRYWTIASVIAYNIFLLIYVGVAGVVHMIYQAL